MKLDGSQKNQTSYFGTCLSIILLMVMILFMYTKIVSLAMKNEVDIMSALDENKIDFNYKFSGEDGFFLAAALTAYDTERNIIEEERYGELVIELYGWGYDGGIGFSKPAPIDYHYCSDEELGFFRGPDTQIFPIFSSQLAEVQLFRNKFKCFKKSSVELWGDFNSARAQQLTVKFKMCEGKSICESKENIREWLKGKYILLLYN